MPQGTIKKLTDKGFGFIDSGRGNDLFFHISALQGVSYDDLHEGQRVQYTEGRGPKGPRAEMVEVVGYATARVGAIEQPSQEEVRSRSEQDFDLPRRSGRPHSPGVRKASEDEARAERILAAALRLFDGDESAARDWIRSPARALGGRRPEECATSEEATRDVEQLVGRLEDGVFT